MVTRTRIALGPAFANLADDSAMSLLEWLFHRDALVDAYLGLAHYRQQRGMSWFIGKQAKLAIPREVGPSYLPAPDLSIHSTLGPCVLATVPIAHYGPPTLVIEVVSGTMLMDNDLRFGIPGGKAVAYAASGIAEYLVFDPCGDFIPEQIAAWRLGPTGDYVQWGPDATDRWVSSLGIAFAPQDTKLRVYDETDELIPSYEELADEREQPLRDAAREHAEQQAQITELQDTLRRLRGEA